MSDLHTTISTVLAAHLPAAKDYPAGVKRCTCGHETPIGDMGARQEHLIDVLTDGLEEIVRPTTLRPSARYL